MEVKKITSNYRLDKFGIVRYQIIMQLVVMEGEEVISSDIDFLTLLGLWGEIELRKYCIKAVKRLNSVLEPEDFANKSQNVRNRIERLVQRGFVKKSGAGKKVIRLKDRITIHKEGNILLNYNLLASDTN